MYINRVTRLQDVYFHLSFLPLSRKSHKAEKVVKAIVIPRTIGSIIPVPKEKIKFKNDAEIRPRVDQSGASANPVLLV